VTCDGQVTSEGTLYREVRRWVRDLLNRGIYLPPRLVIDVYAIRAELEANRSDDEREKPTSTPAAAEK
jgi:hypothetical protein